MNYVINYVVLVALEADYHELISIPTVQSVVNINEETKEENTPADPRRHRH